MFQGFQPSSTHVSHGGFCVNGRTSAAVLAALGRAALHHAEHGRHLTTELVPRRPVPSKRQLTQEYGIAGGTVDKALAVLRGEKLVKTVRGRGIYVTAPEERS